MSFKKVKVVMLPTNEKAVKGDIIGNNKGFTIADELYSLTELSFIQAKVYKLYFLSDEEIKEGDWMFHTLDKKPIQWNGEETESNPSVYGYKKIIATTDKSLVEKVLVKRDEIGDLYRSFYLPEPSQSFIEKYVEEYNKGSQIKEVLVEYEEYGTIMKDFKDINYRIKINPKDNTITIRKAKDSWNREEVIELLQNCWSDSAFNLAKQTKKEEFITFDKWIEENL